jgi:hypothetical protein
MTEIKGTRTFVKGGEDEYCILAKGQEYACLAKEKNPQAIYAASDIICQFADDLQHYGGRRAKFANMLQEFAMGITGNTGFCGACKDREGCQYKPKE